MINIQLLGHPQVIVQGKPLDISRRKSRALLYFLAAHNSPVPRERLLLIFWPELSRSAGLQTLRTTLHGLRKDLDAALEITPQQVGLRSSVSVDVRRFQEVVQSPESTLDALTAALELYRGDFLETFELPDSAEYESWTLVERERYRRMAIRALSQASQLHADAGRYSDALEAVERALAFDPLQEDLQREAIRLLFLAGDRPAAIRRYDLLRKTLMDELGIPPMIDTRQLYDDIVNDRMQGDRLQPAAPLGTYPSAVTPRKKPIEAPAAGPKEDLIPFKGRGEELSALTASTHSATLTLIEGEPGIGKTRLAAEYLQNSDFLPLCGAARELENSLPYQPLIEALRSLLNRSEWPRLSIELGHRLPAVWWTELSRLAPELARGNLARPAEIQLHEESYLWEGLLRFFKTLATIVAPRRVILFLDDLQWADASTLGALGYLILQSPPQEPGPAYLATTRTPPPKSPLSSLVHTLIRENRLARLPLNRLSDEEIASISRTISPDYAFHLSSWLAQNSEGSPFVISELIRYAFTHNLLTRNEGGQAAVLNLNALSEGLTVPKTVYSLTLSRLERLSDPALRVLGAAVAAGRDFDAEVVVRAAAISEHAALDALDELRNAGLIQPLEDLHYTIDHPLTMEVAYQEMGELRYRIYHRRVAEAMTDVYGKGWAERNAGVITFHFSQGQAPERAAPYAMMAGKRASRLAAWKEAISFFETALQGLEDADRIPALLALSNAQQQAGQHIHAGESLSEVILLAEKYGLPSDGNSARLSLAHSYFSQARFDEARLLARQVCMNGSLVDKTKAEFVLGTSYSLEGSDLDSAWRHLKSSEALILEQIPEKAPDFPAEIARVRFELGGVAAQQGQLEQAVALYRSALETACRSEDGQGMVWCILAHNNLAYHLLLMGRPGGQEHVTEGLRLAREKGMLGQLPYLLSTQGEIALADGDLATAQASFSEGLALAERLKIGERIAGLTANLARLDLARGDKLLAIHRFSTALAHAESLGTHHLAAQIRLWLAPLLPAEQAAALISAAKDFAESGGRQYLLKQIKELGY